MMEFSMPDVLVEVRGDWLKGRKAGFLEAIEDGVVAALRTPKEDKILRLIEHSPENFSIPRWASEQFIHIEIKLFRGRSLDLKRVLYSAIVKNVELSASRRTTSRSLCWKCRPPTWGCGEVEQRVIWI